MTSLKAKFTSPRLSDTTFLAYCESLSKLRRSVNVSLRACGGVREGRESEVVSLYPSILLFMYGALEAKAKDENKVNSL